MTGRIITAAAAIMFCVFASFIIKDPLHVLKVFGLGLATAVLVDATLDRPHRAQRGDRGDADGRAHPCARLTARHELERPFRSG